MVIFKSSTSQNVSSHEYFFKGITVHFGAEMGFFVMQVAAECHSKTVSDCMQLENFSDPTEISYKAQVIRG